MMQIIRSSIVHNLHCKSAFATGIHHYLVGVCLEKFLLGSLGLTQIISSIVIFLNKMRLLWVDLVWNLVSVQTKGAIPEVPLFSQISHFLDGSDRVRDGFKVGVGWEKLLLTQLDHQFRLVVENLDFIWIKKFVFISYIAAIFHIWTLKDRVERFLVFGLWWDIPSVVWN